MADKKKMPSTFFNMVMVLTVISLVSALALGFTYSGTKSAIAQVEVKKTLKALKKVLPEFDNTPNPNDAKYTVEVSDDPDVGAPFKTLDFYPAVKDGKSVGTAVKTYSKEAFGEPIWLMVGFDKDDKIYDIVVLKQKETPGLGTKMGDKKFKNQFKGKDPAAFKMKVTKDKGEVDAISAATISSRAFCDAVQRAYDALKGGKK